MYKTFYVKYIDKNLKIKMKILSIVSVSISVVILCCLLAFFYQQKNKTLPLEWKITKLEERIQYIDMVQSNAAQAIDLIANFAATNRTLIDACCASTTKQDELVSNIIVVQARQMTLLEKLTSSKTNHIQTRRY